MQSQQRGTWSFHEQTKFSLVIHRPSSVYLNPLRPFDSRVYKVDGRALAVGALLFNSHGEILVGERTLKWGHGKWQPVQGGLNANETKAQAVLREVQEELGLMPHQYQVVEELPTPISYNFPVFDGLAHRHDDFVGQDLFWWVIYYEGKLEDCFLGNAKEFSSVKWTDWEGLLTECPWYKVDMYKKVKRWAQPVVDGFLSKQRKNKTVV